MLFCLLFLFVTCVFGRVTQHEQNVSNHITLATKPTETNFTATETDFNAIDIDSHVIHNNITNDLSNNNTNTNTNEICVEVKKVDNGTALILTQYLKEGRSKEARIASKVDPSHFLNFKSYSGFLTVNETYNSNLFFWYFPVVNKSVTDSPWIIWMQGGPGASSLIGLFDEIGPFTYINGDLKLNPFTWLQNHSLLFIDNPVGTGYSFTNHKDGYATQMNTYSSHLYSALHQFLQIFPELNTAPLYLAGESYAGKYVPAFAMEIHKRKSKLGLNINLQGLILGNAYVDPGMILNPHWPFYYFGLVGKEHVEVVKPLVKTFQQAVASHDSVTAKRKWSMLITILLFASSQKQGYNFLLDDVPVGRFGLYLNRAEIKRALHVGDIRFNMVNTTVNTKLEPDFLSSTKPHMETLLEHYRVLAYCGQLDQMVPCVPTYENYRTWRWNGSAEFLQATRYPFMYNRKLAGYYKAGGRLTEVLVRGAGHMVPMDTPGPARDLVTRWIHDQPLPTLFQHYLEHTLEEFVRNNTIVQYLI